MKVTISGKRYSKLETRQYDGIDEASEDLKRLGRPNGSGGFEFGYTFESKLESMVTASEEILKKKGLLWRPDVYQVTDKPRVWVDSTDPEDIEREINYWEINQSLYPEQSIPEKPTVGKKLDPTIQLTWQNEQPALEFQNWRYRLDRYVIELLGFDHDSPEGIAARVIVIADEIKKGDRDSMRLAFELGSLFQLVKTYHIDHVTQRQKAKKPRKAQIKKIIERLAKSKEPASELWMRFIDSLRTEGFDPDLVENSVSYFIDSKEQSITYKTFQNNISTARSANTKK